VDTTVAAAQTAQLALDHAAVGAQVEVPPALDAPVMDLEPRPVWPNRAHPGDAVASERAQSPLRP
jgi:hypothetical protein